MAILVLAFSRDHLTFLIKKLVFFWKGAVGIERGIPPLDQHI